MGYTTLIRELIFLEDERVKQRLLCLCFGEKYLTSTMVKIHSFKFRNCCSYSCYCSGATSLTQSQELRLPEELGTSSSIPSLASSFIVDSDVSHNTVPESTADIGRGVLTSTPNRSVSIGNRTHLSTIRE